MKIKNGKNGKTIFPTSSQTTGRIAGKWRYGLMPTPFPDFPFAVTSAAGIYKINNRIN
jgi:hypothetical protein